jgi:kinesin family protein 5
VSQRNHVQLTSSGFEDTNSNSSSTSFTFDAVHESGATQRELYDSCARATIDDVLRGYNGTIFAYGQTGAGKTFTMFGVADAADDELRGIVPRACAQLFDHIAQDAAGTEYTIKCSFLEIYREVVRDLLSPASPALRVRESPDRGVWVDGLSQVFCTSPADIFELLRLGETARATSATNMNAVSSRSHSLFVLELTQKLTDGSTKTGRLNLVDLAGSEKVAKTGASGETLEEAKKINQSLSALGNCIAALTESRSHIPYRDSKLTFILRESLGGNCKTTLLVAASPARSNVEETLSALRFGSRAKLIKNTVTVNVRRSAAQLEELLTFEEWFARRLALELDGADTDTKFLDRRRLARDEYARTGGGGGGGGGDTPQLVSASTSSPSSPSPASAPNNAAQAEALDSALFQIRQLETELVELKNDRAVASGGNAEAVQLRAELEMAKTRDVELEKRLALSERKLLAADDACEAMSLELAQQRLTTQSEIRRAQVAETRSQQALADAERATAATAALESRIVDDQMRVEELMSMVLDLEKDLASAKEARSIAEAAAAEAAQMVLRAQERAATPPLPSTTSTASTTSELESTLADLSTARTESQSLRKQIEILQRLLEERASVEVPPQPTSVAPASSSYEAERASSMAQIKQLTRTAMSQETRIKQLESALLNEQQMRTVEQAQLTELELQCMSLQTASKDKDQVARQLASELASAKRDLADATKRADNFLARLERSTDRLVEVEHLLHQQQQQQQQQAAPLSRIAVPVGGRRVWGGGASTDESSSSSPLRRSEATATIDGDSAAAPPQSPSPGPQASPSRPTPKAIRAAAAAGAELLVPHEPNLSHPERAGFLRLRQPGLLWTKTWRDCYAVLAGKRIYWFFDKTSGEPSGSKSLTGLALLRDAEQRYGTPHSFALLDGERDDELVFAATSDAERSEWVTQIVSRVTKSN